MKLLLDTHILVWAMVGDPRLSPAARRLIEDARQPVCTSLASIWELGIKISIGKLKLGKLWSRSVADWLRENAVEVLPLRWEHCTRIASLPFHHRDPFDRMLVAQALEDRLRLVTDDAVFSAYGVDVIR